MELGNAMREPIRKMMHDQIVEAIEARDQSAYGRAVQGLAPVEITVCLGPGRCLFPKNGSEARICPFCLRYPSGRSSTTDIEAITDRFIKGN